MGIDKMHDLLKKSPTANSQQSTANSQQSTANNLVEKKFFHRDCLICREQHSPICLQCTLTVVTIFSNDIQFHRRLVIKPI
ncbi:MAG: hypothetical protein F6K31_01570 [Symploca sp. SIO2G7]|nr:hypothetical protein [Symploca sp. SIO2G7]